MRNSLKYQLVPLGLTLILLVLFEIIATAFLPAIGIKSYRVPFNILLILYLGFKVNTPFLGVFVLILQYFHSLFSIEGWEMGTVTGITICIIISYLKELLDFSSAFVTILLTELFQILWFVIMSAMFYIKFQDIDFLISKLYRFIPESLFISICSPLVFILMDRIWGVSSKSGALGEQV